MTTHSLVPLILSISKFHFTYSASMDSAILFKDLQNSTYSANM